ncbi:MAG: VOC family protein [Bacillota bacterium]|nr:VOC family protein [Bacillota bacterium]
MIKSVHHISLRANGPQAFEKAISFYKELLGCSVIRRWGDQRGIMLDAGNCILEILSTGPEEDQDGFWQHLAFTVEDLEMVTEKLRSASYPITREPKKLTLGEDYPIYISFCRGPLGEEIEFLQEL